MERDFERYKQRIKNFPQYKNLSEDELNNVARKKFEESEVLDNLTFCTDDEEKKFAQNLLDRYLSQCSFDSESDKDTLKQLIDLQILVERIKKNLNTEYSKANPSLPLEMIEQLQDLEKQVIEVKEKLGLAAKDKKEQTFLDTWENLKKKALKYYEEHRGCNVVKCPHCQNLFYLLLRTEQLTAEKCNWFKGTVLYNKPLMELIEKNILTQDKVAEILGVSSLYVEGIYNNIYLKEKNSDDRQNQ